MPLLPYAAQKRDFLRDMGPVLHLVAGAGSTRSADTYYLLKLTRFLFEAAPAEAFDLMAGILLEGASRTGIHGEPSAVDIVVELIGVCLADHRRLFDDAGRRKRLVECLDLLVGVGSPGARRLVYRLSEDLRPTGR